MAGSSSMGPAVRGTRTPVDRSLVEIQTGSWERRNSSSDSFQPSLTSREQKKIWCLFASSLQVLCTPPCSRHNLPPERTTTFACCEFRRYTSCSLHKFACWLMQCCARLSRSGEDSWVILRLVLVRAMAPAKLCALFPDLDEHQNPARGGGNAQGGQEAEP